MDFSCAERYCWGLPNRTTPASIIPALGEQGPYYPSRRTLFSPNKSKHRESTESLRCLVPSGKFVRKVILVNAGVILLQCYRFPIRAQLTLSVLWPPQYIKIAVNTHWLSQSVCRSQTRDVWLNSLMSLLVTFVMVFLQHYWEQCSLKLNVISFFTMPLCLIFAGWDQHNTGRPGVFALPLVYN